MIVAWVAEDTFVTVNTLELLGIIYLAVAISALRERIARLEGLLKGRDESTE